MNKYRINLEFLVDVEANTEVEAIQKAKELGLKRGFDKTYVTGMIKLNNIIENKTGENYDI